MFLVPSFAHVPAVPVAIRDAKLPRLIKVSVEQPARRGEREERDRNNELLDHGPGDQRAPSSRDQNKGQEDPRRGGLRVNDSAIDHLQPSS